MERIHALRLAQLFFTLCAYGEGNHRALTNKPDGDAEFFDGVSGDGEADKGLLRLIDDVGRVASLEGEFVVVKVDLLAILISDSQAWEDALRLGAWHNKVAH